MFSLVKTFYNIFKHNFTFCTLYTGKKGYRLYIIDQRTILFKIIHDLINGYLLFRCQIRPSPVNQIPSTKYGSELW